MLSCYRSERVEPSLCANIQQASACNKIKLALVITLVAAAAILLLVGVLCVLAQQGYPLGLLNSFVQQIAPHWLYLGIGVISAIFAASTVVMVALVSSYANNSESVEESKPNELDITEEETVLDVTSLIVNKNKEKEPVNSTLNVRTNPTLYLYGEEKARDYLTSADLGLIAQETHFLREAGKEQFITFTHLPTATTPGVYTVIYYDAVEKDVFKLFCMDPECRFHFITSTLQRYIDIGLMRRDVGLIPAEEGENPGVCQRFNLPILLAFKGEVFMYKKSSYHREHLTAIYRNNQGVLDFEYADTKEMLRDKLTQKLPGGHTDVTKKINQLHQDMQKAKIDVSDTTFQTNYLLDKILPEEGASLPTKNWFYIERLELNGKDLIAVYFYNAQKKLDKRVVKSFELEKLKAENGLGNHAAPLFVAPQWPTKVGEYLVRESGINLEDKVRQMLIGEYLIVDISPKHGLLSAALLIKSTTAVGTPFYEYFNPKAGDVEKYAKNLGFGSTEFRIKSREKFAALCAAARPDARDKSFHMLFAYAHQTQLVTVSATGECQSYHFANSEKDTKLKLLECKSEQLTYILDNPDVMTFLEEIFAPRIKSTKIDRNQAKLISFIGTSIVCIVYRRLDYEKGDITTHEFYDRQGSKFKEQERLFKDQKVSCNWMDTESIREIVPEIKNSEIEIREKDKASATISLAAEKGKGKESVSSTLNVYDKKEAEEYLSPAILGLIEQEASFLREEKKEQFITITSTPILNKPGVYIVLYYDPDKSVVRLFCKDPKDRLRFVTSQLQKHINIGLIRRDLGVIPADEMGEPGKSEKRHLPILLALKGEAYIYPRDSYRRNYEIAIYRNQEGVLDIEYADTKERLHDKLIQKLPSGYTDVTQKIDHLCKEMKTAKIKVSDTAFQTSHLLDKIIPENEDPEAVIFEDVNLYSTNWFYIEPLKVPGRDLMAVYFYNAERKFDKRVVEPSQLEQLKIENNLGRDAEILFQLPNWSKKVGEQLVKESGIQLEDETSKMIGNEYLVIAPKNSTFTAELLITTTHEGFQPYTYFNPKAGGNAKQYAKKENFDSTEARIQSRERFAALCAAARPDAKGKSFHMLFQFAKRTQLVTVSATGECQSYHFANSEKDRKLKSLEGKSELLTCDDPYDSNISAFLEKTFAAQIKSTKVKRNQAKKINFSGTSIVCIVYGGFDNDKGEITTHEFYDTNGNLFKEIEKKQLWNRKDNVTA